MPDNPPGRGLLGWLGRQVGHVRKALKSDVTKEPPQVVFRDRKVEEAPHPDQPDVRLRRTTIDEVIVERGGPEQRPEEQRHD